MKQPVEGARAERGPILIVDDELDMRVLLTDLLRAEGFDVVTSHPPSFKTLSD